jgi:sugar (pentulose or hexulose) kinase
LGFGDLQAAFLGSNLAQNEILINIGTGSQIISNSRNNSTFGLEERPFFNNEKLKCVTHIPAGRFLNSWCKFYDTLNSNNNFWKELSQLTYEDLEGFNIDIKFDLYLDSESEYFEQIDDLTSSNSRITPKVLLASLMISFCNQYLSYLEDSISKNSRIILGGGIPNKVPVIADIIEKKMKRKVRIKKNEHDLTLIGLRDFINRGS